MNVHTNSFCFLSLQFYLFKNAMPMKSHNIQPLETDFFHPVWLSLKFISALVDDNNQLHYIVYFKYGQHKREKWITFSKHIKKLMKLEFKTKLDSEIHIPSIKNQKQKTHKPNRKRRIKKNSLWNCLSTLNVRSLGKIRRI